MNVKNPKIQVDNNSINPTLICSIELVFDRSIEIPISVSGKLIGPNHQALSLIGEHHINSGHQYGLRLLSKEQKEQSRKENTPQSHHVELSAELTQLAINSIENQREKILDKSVKLTFALVVKSLNLNHNVGNNQYNDFIEIKIAREYVSVNIQQSEWINKFSQKLGIGKFMLVELEIPDYEVLGDWSKLFEVLKNNVLDMESSIRSGDWQKTMIFARRFFENIKVGDSKKAHKIYRDQLDKKMSELRHSEEGIENLYDGIWKFFEFTSKFIHDKDKHGNSYDAIPIPSKEDAYFVYALSLGLLGLIGSKLES